MEDDTTTFEHIRLDPTETDDALASSLVNEHAHDDLQGLGQQPALSTLASGPSANGQPPSANTSSSPRQQQQQLSVDPQLGLQDDEHLHDNPLQSHEEYANTIASTSQLPLDASVYPDPSGTQQEPTDDTSQQPAAPPTASSSSHTEQPSPDGPVTSGGLVPFPSFHDEPHFLNFDRVEDAEQWLEGQKIYAKWGLKYFHRANQSRTRSAYDDEQAEQPNEDSSSSQQPVASSSTSTKARDNKRKRGPKIKWEWTKIFLCNHAGRYSGTAKVGPGGTAASKKKDGSIKVGCQAKIYMRRRRDSLEVEVEYRWRHNHNPMPYGPAAAVVDLDAPVKPKKLSQHQRQVQKEQRRLAAEQEQMRLQQEADALLPQLGHDNLGTDMLNSLAAVHEGHAQQHQTEADEMDLSGYVQQSGIDGVEDDDDQLDPSLAHLNSYTNDHLDAHFSHDVVHQDHHHHDDDINHHHQPYHDPTLPSSTDAFPPPDGSFALPALQDPSDGSLPSQAANAFYVSLGAPVMASVLLSTIQDALATAEKWKEDVERNPAEWDPLKVQAVSERFRGARDELERLLLKEE